MKTWFGLSEDDFEYLIDNHFQWRGSARGDQVRVDRSVKFKMRFEQTDDDIVDKTLTLFVEFTEFKPWGGREHTLVIKNTGDMCVWAGEEEAPGANNLLKLVPFLLEKGFPHPANRSDKIDKFLS